MQPSSAPGSGVTSGSAGVPARPDFPLRWLGFVSALIIVILLARLLLLPGSNLALYWPAAGVAVLGVAASRTRRELAVVAATIAVVATLGNAITGIPIAAASVLGIANMVMGTAPAFWLASAPGPLRSPHGGGRLLPSTRLRVVQATDLARLVVAMLVGGALSAVPGALAIYLIAGSVAPIALLSWVVRLSVGAFVVAAPLLTLACVTRHLDLSTQPRGWHTWRAWLRERGVEVGLITLAGLALVAVVFAPGHDLPLTYLPLLISVWVGVRMPPAAAGSITLLTGLVTAVLVLFNGGGPFEDVTLSVGNAIIVQGYAFLLVAVAMLLSLIIAERDDLGTRLANAERDAVQRADDLGVITATVPVALMVLDADGEVEMMNPRAAAMVQKFTDESVADGIDGWRSADGTLLAEHELPLGRSLRGETVRNQILLEPIGVGDDIRAWSVDAVRLPHRRQDQDRALLTFRDVTDERAHIAGLEAFAGIVAHDLQNPVSAIQGWTDVALDELADMAVAAGSDDAVAGLRSALDRVRGSTDRATSLIKDLLDYSVGRTAAITKVIVDLDMMAMAVTAGVEHAHAERRPRITVGPLGTVKGDPVLLSQVLTNLVGNAVKYTPPERTPEVQIEARRAEHELVIDVLDRGVGVPASQQESIFEPFARAHRDDARFSGTGLGLAICAQAVHRHGGIISVRPREDGVGSRFTIVLPLQGSVGATAPPVETTSPAPDHAVGVAAGETVTAFAPACESHGEHAGPTETLTD